MKYIPINILLLFILISFSCAEQDTAPKTYTVEMIDGVKHIHNSEPLWDEESLTPKIELVFIRQIGEIDGTDRNLQFYVPNDIQIDSEGNIYVVDCWNHRIQKFDRNANYLLTIGRRGEGPGEFTYPMYCAIDSEDNIHAGCLAHGIQVFDPNGKLLKSYGKMSNTGIMEFSFLKNDNIVIHGLMTSYRRGEPRPADRFAEVHPDSIPLFEIYNKELEPVKKIGKQVDNRSTGKYALSYIRLLAADSDENYYCTFIDRNLILKYSYSGELLFKMDRALQPRESYDTDHVTVDAEGNWRGVENNFSENIHIDGKNRIWISTYKRDLTIEEWAEPELMQSVKPDLIEIEIFDDQGVLLQRIPWEYGFSRYIKLIKGFRVFAIDKNDMCIYEYQIVEK
ncbi:NHL repeat-containing protein [candidate division KSB1 bacterium]